MRSIPLFLLLAVFLAAMPGHCLAAAGQTPASAAEPDARAKEYLLQAVEYGNARQVQYLLKRGAHPDLFDAQTRRLVMEKAVASGDIETVKILLASSEHYSQNMPQGGWRKNDNAMVDFLVAMHGMPQAEREQYFEGLSVKAGKPDYNWDNEDLFVAARKGDTEAMRRLLAAGADPNAVNIDGDAPLTLTAQSGHIEASKILLAGGADINGPGPERKKPAFAALVSRQETMLEFLAFIQRMTPEQREAHLRPYTPDPQHGRRALYPARGGTEHLNAPGEGFPAGTRPGDVRFKNANKTTALMNAAKNGDSPLVQAYLEKGVSIDAREDNTGFTALMYAAANGRRVIVKRLLEAGADINATDAQGWTPLMLAAAKDKHETVMALRDSGADVNLKNKAGDTALMEAALRGNAMSVQALLAAPGLDTEIKDRKGRTALILALDHKKIKVAERLLAAGADPDARDAMGRTPLLGAIFSKNPDAVNCLLRFKADPNAKDIGGRTALVLAVRNGDVDLAKELLEHGAEVLVKVKGNDGLETMVKRESKMGDLLYKHGLRWKKPPKLPKEERAALPPPRIKRPDPPGGARGGPTLETQQRQKAHLDNARAEYAQEQEAARAERDRRLAEEKRKHDEARRKQIESQTGYAIFFAQKMVDTVALDEYAKKISTNMLIIDTVFNTPQEAERALAELYRERITSNIDAGFYQLRVRSASEYGQVRSVRR